MTLRTGTEIAGYRIDGVLGSGGMGVVYEATQLALGRPVALKVLTAGHGSDEFRIRFRREAMLQAALEHPHIVPVYEAGESDEGLFIAMRLVRGQDLKRLSEDGTLPVKVDLVEELGSDAYVYGKLAGTDAAGTQSNVVARVDPRTPPAMGDTLHLRIRPDELHVFSATGDGARLP